MPKITIRNTGGGDPRTWIKQKIDMIEGLNRATLENSIDSGADLMASFIASRPTEWMAANMGKTGRIETERMLDAVDSKVKSSSDTKWTGAFGWVNDREGYFLVQDLGGKNTFTGGQIEGMYAKQDAASIIWDRLKAEIEENIRGA